MQLRWANAAVEVNCSWYKDHHPNQLHFSFSAADSTLEETDEEAWLTKCQLFSAVESFKSKMQDQQMHLMGRSWGGLAKAGIWMPIKWPNQLKIHLKMHTGEKLNKISQFDYACHCQSSDQTNFFTWWGRVKGWVWIVAYSTFSQEKNEKGSIFDQMQLLVIQAIQVVPFLTVSASSMS